MLRTYCLLLRKRNLLRGAFRKYLSIPKNGMSGITKAIYLFAENPIIQVMWKDDLASKFKKAYRKTMIPWKKKRRIFKIRK